MNIKMTKKQTIESVMDSLERIYWSITNDNFLSQKWLWNEIPFYIYDYPSEFELLIRDHVKKLLKKISKNNSKLKVIEIDLYEAMLEIIKDKWLLDKVIEIEKTKWTGFVEKALKPIIKAENFNNYIEEKSNWCDIIFLTWVWKIYPLLRSHTILNNLHHVIPWINLIMFFPWEYTKSELKLFSQLKDDNYYRAFRLNVE